MGREICPISLLMQKGMCNMSTKKNFLARAQALLLAAVLTLSLLPVSAFAAENDLPQEVTPSVGQNAEVEYIGEELNVSTSSEDSAETGATDSLPSSAYSKQEDAAPTTETLALMEAQSIEETPPSPLEFSFYDVSTTKTTSLELRQAEDGTYTLYIPVSGVVDRNHCIKIIAPESYTEIFSLKYDSYVPGAYKIAPSPWEAKSEEGILTAEAYSVGSAPSLGDTELMFSRSMQLYVDGATYDISVQPYCDLETVGVEESKPLPTYRSNIARPYKEIELFKYYATAVTGKEITVKPNVNSNVSALLDPKGHNGCALVDGVKTNAFSGIIDGDGHKIIIPKGGLPLIGYARDAVVKNLNIYGEEINGYGLLNNYVVDYGDNGDYNVGDVPETIRIENCRLLKGSSTLKSGFIGGYASGKNYVYIIDCTIEEGVTIGYTGAESGIGSFGGEFNGMLINCTSSATVKGKNRVGGLVGNKGQSMGLFQIQNCSFTGAVIATGNYVGGILGSGYNAWSAPNSPLATVRNCFVSGSITGADKIGGITGGEPGVVQAWGNGAGDVVDNVFYGTITATGEGKFVGGIIGYMQSLNKYNWVSDNYYCEDSGAAKGIGEIAIVDTSAEHETDSNTRYVNTAIEVPDIFGFDQRGGYNRTDDPVGKDADKLVKRVTKEDLTNETVVALLNSSKTSFRNWIQGATGPILRQEAVAYELVVGGEIKNQHYVGDALNLSGLTLTAKWSDGTTTNVPLNDPNLKITGYDSGKHGQQTVTLQYGAAKVEIVVTVLYKEPEDITVTITLLGDKAHGDNGQVHGLSKGGLTAWVSGHKVEVTTNMTVWDALQQLPGVTWDNPTGNYIKSVTYGGVTIGEFTNGKNSGWMYTLNGKYPMLGVSEQYLKKGDVIVFHYTDDYTLEAADMGPAPEEKKTTDEVIALINAIGVVDLTKGDVIAKARAAYDALSAADKKLVTNYQTLLDAEAAYAKLVAELGKKADSIYKTTGDYLAKLGTPGVGSIGGEWMALGLARSGRTVPGGYYDAVVKYVKDNIDSNGRLDKNKATENARIILALTAIGKDVTNVDGHDLLAGLNEMSYLSKQGINGAIFTLIALDSHNYTPAGDVTRDKLVQAILDAQISGDGGWSLDGKNADVDMTAMAIQALAAYYKSNSSAKKAVDKGLSWLSSVQQNDGGFTSWGAANSESCAQVIVALTALGINPAKDSRFIKNGASVLDALCSFAVDGGGFKHLATETSANGMATEQGFYALVAYYRLLNGQSSLYDMADVKLEGVKTEESVNDADKPDDATNTDTPVDTEVEDTSSGGQVVLWVVIGAVAVGGITALAVTSKKRHGRGAE